MKKLALISLVCLLVPTFGLLAAPADDSLVEAAPAAETVVTTGGATGDVVATWNPDGASVVFAAAGGENAAGCSAEAECANGEPLWCSTSGPSTCQGVDQNCSLGERGFVRCGSQTYYCDPCDDCVNGDTRWVNNGCCCVPYSVPRQRSSEQICTNGQWQYTGVSACAQSCQTPSFCGIDDF